MSSGERRFMRVKAKTLVWIAVAVGVVTVLSIVLYPYARLLQGMIARQTSREAKGVPACSTVLARAERALSQHEPSLALALADSAWQTEINEQDSTDYAVSAITYRDPAGRFLYWRDPAEAESLLNRIRRIREVALGPDHPELAFDWHDLALLYDSLWRHHESLPFYRRMLEIRETALDPLHPDMELSIFCLANHCRHLGRYVEAESLFRRGLDLMENLYRSNIHDSDDAAGRLSRVYDELGHVCMSQGKYAEAERFYRESLAIREATYGARLPQDVGASCAYLGGLYWALGQQARAGDLFQRSLELREAGLGPDHPDVASSLSSVAMVKASNREYEEAERLYKRVLDIRRRTIAQGTPGGAHPGIAMSLNRLGWIYTCQGKYAEAERTYKDAIAIWNKAFRFEHPRSIGTIEDLAYNYAKAGEYPAAEKKYADALEIAENTLGPEHPRVAEELESLCAIYRLERRPGDAVPIAKRAVEIRLKNFRENALTLAERDALSFSRSLARSRDNFISCLVDAGMVRAWKEVLTDIVLATKGPVSDEMFERLKGMTSATDSTTLALRQLLRDSKSHLSNLWMAAPEPDPVAYCGRVGKVQDQIEEIERALAQRVAGRPRDETPIKWQLICDRLPEKCTLIEYLRWEYFDPLTEMSTPRYLAIILRNDTVPSIVLLADAQLVEEAVGNYRKHMDLITQSRQWPDVEDLRLYGDISEALYGLVLRPIETSFSASKTLVVAPDGALNLVSFSGLRPNGGAYLVESYAVQYLSSARDMARVVETGSLGKGLLVMADPDFGRPLPGARQEAEWVASSWCDGYGEPVIVHLGVDASEQRFKADAPGKRAIHIAAHGFSLRDDRDQGRGHMGGTGLRSVNLTNPLLITGLYLAGTRTAQGTAEAAGSDDGVLTAYEVTAMDLAGTELVVLSTCESGLGSIEDGEGVYGLRRAFQYAGARTVISALWPLADEVPDEVVRRVYSLSDDPLPERLRNMQMDIIASLKRKGENDHPYIWAGLIVTGAWKSF